MKDDLSLHQDNHSIQSIRSLAISSIKSSHASSKHRLLQTTPKEKMQNFFTGPNRIFVIVAIILVFVFTMGVILYHYMFQEPVSGFESLFVAQPFTESNDFKYVTLSNGVKVLIVRPNIGLKHSYVALTVGVGSEADPADFVGFTHLIEHLLFTGSKNYPIDNYIEKVVNKYHGENNGVTKAFTTSYYYTLEREGFEEFAAVLVDAVRLPLFSADMIAKEINNVNSEISMRMTFNKHLGYYKLIKAIGNKEAKIFSDGFANIDPKAIDPEKLRERILEFHDKYYSANIMTLAVISEADSEHIKKVVEDKFSIIPNKHVERPFFNETKIEPFSDDAKGRIYYMQGFSEPSTLSLVFKVDPEKGKYDFHPLVFFSTFFNYYSDNSLKQKLIKDDLITSMNDEIALQDYNTAIYILTFDLTARGKQNMSEIIEHLFGFINFIKKLESKKETFEALAKISKYGFMFNLKNSYLDFSNVETDPFERVLEFSETIQEYTPDTIFILNNILHNYDEKAFNKLLDQLNISNTTFIVESTDFTVTAPPVENKPQIEPRELRSLKTIRRLIMEANKGGRLLAENTDNDNIGIDQFYHEYLNNSLQNVELSQRFDFDGGRAYTSRPLPKSTIDKLHQNLSGVTNHYDILENLDTNYLDSYAMITKCSAPANLAIQTHTKSSSILSSASTANNAIDTKKVFDVYFQKTSSSNRMTKLELLRDLTLYKYCLIEDFDDDDNVKHANVVVESDSHDVYHKLYRKTLQPKYMTMIEIEAEYLIDAVVHSTYEDKLESMFALEMFCLYITKHIELKFHKEFMKGNDFGCRVSNYHIILEFEGPSGQLAAFVQLIVEQFDSFKDDEVYDEGIITNLKRRIINNYSDFDSKTSMKACMYYLGLAVDKLFIDYSTTDKLEQLVRRIQQIDAEDLVNIMEGISINNKLNFFYVGNIDGQESANRADELRKLDVFRSGTFNKDTEIEQYRKYITEKLVIKLDKKSHYMVRLPNIDPYETNSVYLSYFSIGIMGKKDKLLAMVMIHFLKNKVFDRMRNQLNLGYVAHAGLRMFYHVS